MKNNFTILMAAALLLSACQRSVPSEQLYTEGSYGVVSKSATGTNPQAWAQLKEKVDADELNLFNIEALLPGVYDLMGPDQAELALAGYSDLDTAKARAFIQDAYYSELIAGTGLSVESLKNTLPFQEQIFVDILDFKRKVKDGQEQLDNIRKIMEERITDHANNLVGTKLKEALEQKPGLRQEIKEARSQDPQVQERQLQSVIEKNKLDEISEAADSDKKYINSTLMKILGGPDSELTQFAIDAGKIKAIYDEFKIFNTVLNNFKQISKNEIEISSEEVKKLKASLEMIKDQVKEDFRSLQSVDDIKKFLKTGAPAIGKLGKGVKQNVENIKASASKIFDGSAKVLAAGQSLLNLAEKTKLISPKAAQKVGKAISNVQKGLAVAQGFASGGPVGAAMAAISISGIGGSSGSDSAIMGMLSEMNRKLDEIIVTLQNMTTMIERNQDVLLANLSALAYQAAALDKLAVQTLREKYDKCDLFVSGVSAFNTQERLQKMHQGSLLLATNFEALKTRLASGEGMGRKDYRNCYEGVREIFAGKAGIALMQMRPLETAAQAQALSLFQVDDERSMLDHLSSYYESKSSLSLDSNLAYSSRLHLPFGLISKVSAKVASSQNTQSDRSYFFNEGNFLSPIHVINEVKVLVDLAPIITILGARGNWKMEQFANIPSQDDQQIYSLPIFESALSFVNTAIAQESLVAGEPLLKYLYEDFASVDPENPNRGFLIPNTNDKVQLDSDGKGKPEEQIRDFCAPTKNNGVNESESAFCLVGRNKILQKNFLIYLMQMTMADHLRRNNNGVSSDKAPNIESYKDIYFRYFHPTDDKALSSGDDLQKVYFQNLPDFVKKYTRIEGNTRKVIIAGHLMDFPTPEEYQQNTVVYRYAMNDLVTLQKRLADIIAKSRMMPKRTFSATELDHLLIFDLNEISTRFPKQQSQIY